MLFVNSNGFYTGFPIEIEEGENDFVIVTIPSEEETFDPRLWSSLTWRSIIC